MKRVFLLPVASLFLASAAVAEAPRLLLSSPDELRDVILSPDGETLFFVREVTGTPQLFRTLFLGERLGLPQIIAEHPGGADSPTLSLDGRQLAFVSRRESALGDIFLLPRLQGQPIRISNPGEISHSPFFTPDGRYLVYTEEPLVGEPRLIRYDLRTRNQQPIDLDTETSALPYPLAGGNPFGPVFLLYADDTDRNGILGEGDHPSAWIQQSGRWVKILPATESLDSAALTKTGSQVIFSAASGASNDLFITPRFASGTEEPQALLKLHEQAVLFEGSGSERAIALARKALFAASPDSKEEAIALLVYTRELNRAGRFRQVNLERQTTFRNRTAEGPVALQFLIAEGAVAAIDGLPLSEIRSRIVRLRDDFSGRGDHESALDAGLILLRLDEFTGAPRVPLAAQAQELLTEFDGLVPQESLAQVQLFRISLFQQLGLLTELESAILALLRSAIQSEPTLNRAADLLIRTAQERSDTDDRHLIELRIIRDRARGIPHAESALLLEEGRVLLRLGDRSEALRSFLAAAEFAEFAPGPSVLAVNQAEILLKAIGRHDDAVNLRRQLVTALDRSDLVYAISYRQPATIALRAGILAQAREELRLGDPLLALRTYRGLIAENPDDADAIRGSITALAARPEFLRQSLPELRAQARRSSASALEHYRYALALSFLDPDSRTARREVARALRMDPTLPHAYLLQGFLLENIDARARERGRQRLDALDQAVDSYELALTLVPPDLNDPLRADLLLNSANTALQLQQFNRSSRLYSERLALAEPFIDPLTELLFHWNYSIAASRSNEVSVALQQAREALSLLERPAIRRRLDTATIERIRTELMGREALALMDLQQHRAAREAFARFQERTPPDSLARVRAIRNRSILALREAMETSGAVKLSLLVEAESHADAGLRLLSQRRLVPDQGSQAGGGLISLSFVLTADAVAGGARFELDRQDEERLLRATRATIQQQRGLLGESVAELRQLDALTPRLNDNNRAYFLAKRAVTASRLAALKARDGEPTEALTQLETALAGTQFRIARFTLANATAATRLLAQIAELRTLHPQTELSRSRAVWWMLEENPESLNDWELLQRAAERLSVLRDPADPAGELPLVMGPEQQARLLYVRVLALDGQTRMLKEDQSDLEQIIMQKRGALAARELTRQLQAQHSLSDDPREIARYILQSLAIQLRFEAATSLGSNGMDESLIEADMVFRQLAYPSMEWWVLGQAALAAGDSELRRRLLNATEATLRRNAILVALDSEVMPDFLLLEQLARLDVDLFRRDNNPIAAWDRAEFWRTLTLAVIGGMSTPIARTQAERAAAERLLRARDEVRRQQDLLRRIPARQARQRAVAEQRLDTARAEEGVASAQLLKLSDRFAALLNPTPGSFSDVSVLLEPPFFFDQEPEFLLGLGDSLPAAVYTMSRQEFAAEQPQADRSSILLGAIRTSPENVTLILNSRDFLSAFQRITLRVGSAPVIFSQDDLIRWEEGERPAALATAAEVHFDVPILATGSDPALWILGDSAVPLSSVITAAEAAESMTLTVTWHHLPPSNQASRELLLAGWLRQAGVLEATINGRRWIGSLIDPSTMPELAEEELAVARGELVRALEEGRNNPGIRATERIILLREALGEQDNLDIDYSNHAQLLARAGRFPESVRAANRAVELSRVNAPEALTERLILLGDLATRTRDWAITHPAYEEALALIPASALAEREDVMERFADALERSSEFGRALTLATELLEIAQQRNDVVKQVDASLRQSRIARRYLSEYLMAEQFAGAAESVAREAADDQLLTRVLIEQSRIAQAVAEFAESDRLLDEADQLARALDHQGFIAEVLLERANSAWLRSDYFNAFSAHQALTLTPVWDDREDLRIAGGNVSGLTSWAINDLTRAFRELDTALLIAQDAAIDPEIASTSNNLGLIHRSAGNLHEAMRWFEKALEIDLLEGNRWGEAYSRRNIGITLHLDGRPAEAIPFFERAAGLASTIGDRVNEAKSRVALGDALQSLGDEAAARTAFLHALELSRTIPVPEVEWRALYGLARVALSENDDPAAEAFLTEAVERVDSIRAAIRIEEFQDGFLIDKQDLYNELVRFFVERNRIDDALLASERSRGRNFIDLLGARSATFLDTVGREDLATENMLRTRIERLERQFLNSDESDQQSISQELEEARQRYTDFLLLLRARNPQLSSFIRVEPPTIESIRELVDPDSVLLSYHLLPEATLAWIISPEETRMIRIDQSRETISDAVREMRVRLQNFEMVDPQIVRVSELLWWPIAEQIPAGTVRIGIVPHQELHTLPFSVLQDRRGRLLIEELALYHTPSLGVLSFTKARRDQRDTATGALAIGNPDLGSAALDLPFAQKEAERLPFDLGEAIVRIGSEATESWLIENISNFGIIHIAAHGEYDPDTPLFSAVFLAPDQTNDGVLTAEEIFGLQIRADLVALSACQTGLGRITAGDEIIGLNRAFVYAGTRQLMTTLWRVDDVSTAVLFKRFYRLTADQDRAEALRRAQLDLRARPEYRHPAHWAGLVLSGDWQ